MFQFCGAAVRCGDDGDVRVVSVHRRANSDEVLVHYSERAEHDVLKIFREKPTNKEITCARVVSGPAGALGLICGAVNGCVKLVPLNVWSENGLESAKVTKVSSCCAKESPVLQIRVAASLEEVFVLYADNTVARLIVHDFHRGMLAVTELYMPPGLSPRMDFVPLPQAPLLPNVLTPELLVRHTDQEASCPRFYSAPLLVAGKDPFLAVVAVPAPHAEDFKSYAMRKFESGTTTGMVKKVGTALFNIVSWFGASSPKPANTETELRTQGALKDPNRAVFALYPRPDDMYVASCDNLGRVLLVDPVAGGTVVRMLKGYRDAVCVWFNTVLESESSSDMLDSDDFVDFECAAQEPKHKLKRLPAFYLAVYTPQRNIVDIWDTTEASPKKRLTVREGDTIAPVHVHGRTRDTLCAIVGSGETDALNFVQL